MNVSDGAVQGAHPYKRLPNPPLDGRRPPRPAQPAHQGPQGACAWQLQEGLPWQAQIGCLTASQAGPFTHALQWGLDHAIASQLKWEPRQSAR